MTASTASSLDGRSFSCAMAADAPLTSGDLVELATVDGRRLCGQLHDKQLAGPGQAVGGGAVLGAVDDDRGVRAVTVEPFASATLTGASGQLWDAVQHGAAASMPIGSARAGQALLRPGGINRHTFLCGQSGSGKSYALGVLLEQIVLDTNLPLVVLDPNADFVRLGEPTDGASAAEVQRLSDTRFDVLRAQAPDADRLCVGFGDLNTASKAAVLRLDPLSDRQEYNALLDRADQLRTRTGTEVIAELLQSSDPVEIRLAQRMRTLGVLDWHVWVREHGTTLAERLKDRARVTVLDLSGFEQAEERLVVALHLLNRLWAAREQRQPTLLVIDEAHNVCRAEPATALEREATARLVQIANEGRKYGLWLLLCTQRPSRIHPAVLSQCDNLALMRMNSRADLAQLQETFGFVPPAMLDAAPFFRQGECLLAGGFSAVPTFVQIGARRTHQGGLDVPVPLRG